MYLKTILFVYFIFNLKIMEQKKFDDRDKFLARECRFDKELSRRILLYKPMVHYIMSVITSKPISEDFYDKYSTFIDKFGPRPSGTVTLEKAIDYIKELTHKSGVRDVTTENVLVPRWKREHESVNMIQPHFRNMAVLGIGYSAITPPSGITAEVIIVGSFEEFEELDDDQVVGKIVLFNANFTSYMDTIKYRTQSASKAAKKGAVAVLVRSITPFSLYNPHTGALEYERNIKKIPAAAITIEDADLMQRIYDRGEKVVVNVRILNTLSSKMSRNVLIDLKGEKRPDKIVIVSGHMDSWDVGQGAMDNGGGMMISWFVPVILNHLNLRPRRTIRAALWTSEEFGLIGGISYIKRHFRELHNIDFIFESDAGTFKPLGLTVAGSNATKCLIAKILQIFYPIDKIRLVNNTGSEMSLFVDKGIPGASLLNKNDRYFWYHHSNADTMTVQSMRDVVQCAAFYAAISYVVADLPINIPKH